MINPKTRLVHAVFMHVWCVVSYLFVIITIAVIPTCIYNNIYIYILYYNYFSCTKFNGYQLWCDC